MRISSSHSLEDRNNDAYWTPPEATKALVKLEKLPRSVADPACGNGAILKVLKDAGHITFGSDIIDYGWSHTVIRDYLSSPLEMNGTGIVTNPPYKLAAEFIHKALRDKANYAAFLLRVNFVESMHRYRLFKETPPSRILVSSRRLPMMHRLGWTGPEAPSNTCYAWFIWDDSKEKSQMHWFDWRE